MMSSGGGVCVRLYRFSRQKQRDVFQSKRERREGEKEEEREEEGGEGEGRGREGEGQLNEENLCPHC